MPVLQWLQYVCVSEGMDCHREEVLCHTISADRSSRKADDNQHDFDTGMFFSLAVEKRYPQSQEPIHFAG